MTDDRGARRCSRRCARARPSSSHAAPEVDASFLHGRLPAGRAAGVRRAGGRDARVRGGLLAARPDRAPVLHVVLEPRRPADDALPRRRPRVGLVDAARGRPRPLRPRDRRLAAAHAARAARRRSGSTSRRAAPGRTSSVAAGRSGTHWYGPLQETFPDALRDVELDAFVRAINRAEPGLIRVDADETTYSLHIILRFELEQELIEGTVALEDLPESWNARMKEFLGVDVPDDAHGVLQDVHWSGGGIGYFPTYALGNVISLQIWERVREALPGPRRAAGGRRAAAALRLAARQPLLARPQADAEGDDRAADRLAGDRPGALPRLPARQAAPLGGLRRWRSRSATASARPIRGSCSPRLERDVDARGSSWGRSSEPGDAARGGRARARSERRRRGRLVAGGGARSPTWCTLSVIERDRARARIRALTIGPRHRATSGIPWGYELSTLVHGDRGGGTLGAPSLEPSPRWSALAGARARRRARRLRHARPDRTARRPCCWRTGCALASTASERLRGSRPREFAVAGRPPFGVHAVPAVVVDGRYALDRSTCPSSAFVERVLAVAGTDHLVD